MLSNYLKIAVRHLRRNLGYTIINLAGLAIGMAACVLIGLYVGDELSYDAFHEDADRILVVGMESDFFAPGLNTPYPLGTALAESIPEVEQMTRLRAFGDRPVATVDGTYEGHHRVLLADAAFFEMFDFPLVRGASADVLAAPGQAVIARSMARTVFGEAEPLGRVLRVETWSGTHEVTVAAVAEDAPPNSTIQFDLILPLEAMGLTDEQRAMWGSFRFETYVRLTRPMPAARFDAQMQRAIAPHVENASHQFKAVPLGDVYLSEFYGAEAFSGRGHYVYLFATIGLFILLIAAINYVNLVTAQAGQRVREVGVRKTMGARPGQIALQLVGETLLLSMAALVLALGLVVEVLPHFNAFFGKTLSFEVGRHAWMLAALCGFVLFVNVAAGLYPAFGMASYNPTRAFRGSSTAPRGGGWLRRGLVVTQFAVSAGLILGTIVIQGQLDYLQTKHLGFDGEQVVTIPLSVPEDRRETLKQQLTAHPAVLQATAADAMPGGFNVSFSADPATLSSAAASEQETVDIRPARVDVDYLPALGMALVAGRNFSVDQPSDRRQAYILNQAAAEAMGWTAEDAVGKPFTFGHDEQTPVGAVIGVVENFHIETLKKAVKPVVLQLEAERFSSGSVIAAKLAPDDIPAAMEHVQAVVAQHAPKEAFEYAFLDDTFDAMYRAEQQLGQIFSVFAFVAVFIACLGLFGLAAFAAQRRTKEIGIRKVLGASVAGIVGLLSREFAVLVGVALLIGTPVAYWGLGRWLEEFAYRIDVGIGSFVLAGVLALLIAGLSVSYHAVRAARANPVEALRYE